MSFVHVFGVNVDVEFIIFAIMAVCALAIGIRVATMKGKYVNDTDSNDKSPDLHLYNRPIGSYNPADLTNPINLINYGLLDDENSNSR